jgi:hypothetical protein
VEHGDEEGRSSDDGGEGRRGPCPAAEANAGPSRLIVVGVARPPTRFPPWEQG